MNENARRTWPWRRDRAEEKAESPEPAPLSPPSILLEGGDLRERYRVSGSPTFMFISLFGMTEDAIAERAALVDEELAQQSLIPVYLVDKAEFKPFRTEQRLFEYLPSRWQGMQRAADLDWPFYLRRRYLLLQAKWQPIGRIDFGDIPDWLPDHQSSTPSPDAETPRP